MFCEKCGMQVTEGKKFCPNCGFRMPVYCHSCGRKIKDNEKFCSECGAAINEMDSQRNNSFIPSKPTEELNSNRNRYDHYRNELAKKSQIEQYLLVTVAGAVLLFSIFYYINNPGEDRFLETLVMAGLIAGVLMMAYNFIAGNMGVLEATKYLKKFDTIREMAGEKEAVLFIEKEYNPKERGKGVMAETAGIAGGCFMGSMQMVIGFILSVIAVILIMAFC